MPASKAVSSFDVYEGAAYDRKTNNTVMNNHHAKRGGVDSQQQRHLITETNFFNSKELEANVKNRQGRAAGVEFPNIMQKLMDQTQGSYNVGGTDKYIQEFFK